MEQLLTRGGGLAVFAGVSLQRVGRVGHPSGPPWPLCSRRQHGRARAVSTAAAARAAGTHPPLLDAHLAIFPATKDGRCIAGLQQAHIT